MDKDIIVASITYVVGPLVTAIAGYLLASHRSKKKHAEKMVSLEYHPVFARLEALKQSVETEFTLTNKGKEAVFRDILVNKIEIFRDNLLTIAIETEECMAECTAEQCNKIYNRNMEILEKSIREYNNYYFNGHYTQEEKICLQIVMTKFNKWHGNRVEQTKEAIESICNSKFYYDCRTVQSVILDWYIGAFVGTFIDAKVTLDSLNGDLRGLKFRGYTL